MNHRAEESEGGEKVAGPRRVEAEPARGEQRERGLKDREREPVQEVDRENAPDDRPLHQVRQIAKWIAGSGVGAMHRLRQPEPRHGGCDERNRGGRPDRRRVTDPGQHAADGRTKDEAKAERRADEAIGAGAIPRIRHIGDVGARGRNVPARQPVDDARGEEQGDAVRDRQHDEADDSAGKAEYQHRSAAVAVRQIAEGGRRDQLTEREHRKQQTDSERRGAECLGVKRQERDDNPEPDQIDKDCKKDDAERTRHNGDNILYNQRT